MNKLLTVCVVFVAATFSLAAMAAPGEYWEVTSKVEMAGMPFSMPAHTMRVCLPKGGQHNPHRAMPSKNCRLTDLHRSGDRTSWKVRCDQNGEVMYGTGHITSTANSYHGTMHVRGNSGGMAMDMTTQFSGRRLGQPCDAPNR